MKKFLFSLFCMLIMVPSVVSAHTGLTSSNPAEGQVVGEDLKEISLSFNTAIENLSTMKLFKNGTEIAIADIHIQDKQMIGSLTEPLENDSYTVKWTIAGEDGHPINGEINFTVQKTQKEEVEPAKEEEENLVEETDKKEDEPKKESINKTEEKEQTQAPESANILSRIILIGLVVILGIGLIWFMRKKK